jgi:hypothetical protein
MRSKTGKKRETGRATELAAEVPAIATGGERSEPEGAIDARRGRPGRRSVDERTSAVLAPMAGKASVDQLARQFGVHPSTIEKWRQLTLEGVSGALRRARDLVGPNGIRYDIMASTKHNLDQHARRMSDQLFRMIGF